MKDAAFYFELLANSCGTSASPTGVLLAIWFVFEHLLAGFHYFIDDVYVDFPELPTKVGMNHGVQLTKYLA